MADGDDDFEEFVVDVERRLRRALVGAVGVNRLDDAVAEALAYLAQRSGSRTAVAGATPTSPRCSRSAPPRSPPTSAADLPACAQNSEYTMLTLEEQIKQLADAVDDQLALPANVDQSSARPSRRSMLTAAAAILVLGGFGAIAAVGGLGDAEPGTSATPPSAETPVMSEASCAFEYNPSTLAERSWAFDGTLISLDSVDDSQLGPVPSATFSVNQWYRGGSGDLVTVQFEMGSISEFVREVEPGARLLVTGEPRWGGQPLDDPVAWGCGFTQSWNADAAESWAHAFGA